MQKAQASSLGALGWVLLIPVFYYFSIFPVVIGLNLCFDNLSHVPTPLITGISNFYYPWGILADTFPFLGLPLEIIDRIHL